MYSSCIDAARCLQHRPSQRESAIALQHYTTTTLRGHDADPINPPSMLECRPDPTESPLEAMAKRSTRTTQKRTAAAGAARTQIERPPIIHSSLYLPEAVYESLRKIAFEERRKIHDIVLEAIIAALRRRGYPSVEKLSAGKRR